MNMSMNTYIMNTLITIIMNIVIYSMLIKLLMKVKLMKKRKILLNVSF